MLVQSFTALADGNQHIRIREKKLEFSTVLLCRRPGGIKRYRDPSVRLSHGAAA